LEERSWQFETSSPADRRNPHCRLPWPDGAFGSHDAEQLWSASYAATTQVDVLIADEQIRDDPVIVRDVTTREGLNNSPMSLLADRRACDPWVYTIAHICVTLQSRSRRPQFCGTKKNNHPESQDRPRP
ncbi:MAG TPA: hypothetical protein PKW99_15220, partial [Thauera sp.]|nr:hypothetical protein [Thauera sp.]